MILPSPKAVLRRRIVNHIDARFRDGRSCMLFVVGHMRSGSSLLVHILASHPDIVGYGETHRRYGRPEDFAENAFEIYRSFSRYWPRERYVLDKVLGSGLRLTAELLKQRYTKTILLVRRPQESLPSILERELPNVRTPEAALDNYLDRLAAVRELATSLGPASCAFLRYDRLIQETEATLHGLTKFLGLRSPLREEYETMWSTGRRRIGDSSHTIFAGTVVRTTRSYRYEVPPAIMAIAGDAYEGCVDTCTRVLASDPVTDSAAGARP